MRYYSACDHSVDVVPVPKVLNSQCEIRSSTILYIF